MSTFLVSTKNGKMGIKAKTSGSGAGLSTYYLDISSTLIAWYNFTNTNGLQLQNAAPNITNGGYDGTNMSSTSIIYNGVNSRKSGKNSAYFDGSNYINMSPTLSVGSGSSGITIAFWIYNKKPNFHGCPSVFGDSAGSNNIAIMWHSSAGYELVANYNGGFYFMSNATNNTGGVTDLNNWVHIVYTISPSPSLTSKFYVNATIVQTQSFPYYTIPDPSWNIIGGNYYQNYLVNGSTNPGGASGQKQMLFGYMDDYRVYNSVLSQTDVTNLYNFTK